MARVTPFTACWSATPEPAGAEVEDLTPATIRRWIERGAVHPDTSPAFHVLEVSPPGGRAARFAAGALRERNGAERPLEEASSPPPPLPLTPCLAADDHGVLAELLETAVAGAPEATQVRPDGTRARAFAVRDPALVARFSRALDDVTIRPLQPLPAQGPALVAVAPLSDAGLELRSWHRGLRGLDVFQEDRFLTLVGGYARVYDLPAGLGTQEGRMEAAERMATLARGSHAMLLALPGGVGKILRVRQGLELQTFPAMPRNPTLRSVDLALLDALVLRTVLGLKDPEHSDHVVAVASLHELVSRVESGELQAGFALHPPPLWEIRAVMEAGQSLPPRCVRVEPLPPQRLLFLDPGAEG
ncbi:MAG TPA: DUF1015 domain-containing protein [Myxococcaceae bacterium]|nr:DUF1015 domain-containing protein [Myxococcaceae bacterium]